MSASVPYILASWDAIDRNEEDFEDDGVDDQQFSFSLYRNMWIWSQSSDLDWENRPEGTRAIGNHELIDVSLTKVECTRQYPD